MKLVKTPSDSVVPGVAQPISLEGGEHAVLLIHGFTGYPGEMRYAAERLHGAEFSVTVPRLPGHGTNGSDFLQSTWCDWLRRCVDAYLELRSRHSTVSVAGLSMGGVLAALLSSHFAPERLALLAPAVWVSNRLLPLTPFVAPFVSHWIRSDRISERRPNATAEEAALEEQYDRYEWVRPASHLLKLQRMARRSLARITSETLCIVSTNDTTVPAAVSGYLERRMRRAKRFEGITIHRSGHVIVDDVEKELVADQLISWFLEGRPATSAGDTRHE